MADERDRQREPAAPAASVRPQERCDPKLLEFLVCPLSKASLDYDEARQELISRTARLAYPIRSGVPHMLPSEARSLDQPAPPVEPAKE